MFNRDPKVFKLIRGDSPEKLRKYLAKNADELERIGPHGQTPLIHAAYEGRPEMLRVILEFNPNLEAQSSMGNTALHLAADRSYVQIVTALLEAGASTDIINNRGETAKGLASPAIRSLFDDGEETPAKAQIKLTGEFQKQSKHIVSYTAPTENPEYTITSIYNFEAKTVSYLSGVKGSSPNVVPFSRVASFNELKDAAAFLEAEKGDLHGWKPLAVN